MTAARWRPNGCTAYLIKIKGCPRGGLVWVTAGPATCAGGCSEDTFLLQFLELLAKLRVRLDHPTRHPHK